MHATSAIAVIALPNHASVRLHERTGFTQVARLADAGFKLGSWHDVTIWQRVLNSATGTPAEPRPVDNEPSAG